MGVIKNVVFAQLTTAAKEELKSGVQESFAEKANVPKSFVSVELSEGSVKVSAEIRADAGVSSDSIRAAVSAPDMATGVVKLAKSIEGVKKAAVGEIEVTKPEVAVMDGSEASTSTVSKAATTTPLKQSTTTPSGVIDPHTSASGASNTDNNRMLAVVVASLAIICTFFISS